MQIAEPTLQRNKYTLLEETERTELLVRFTKVLITFPEYQREGDSTRRESLKVNFRM